MTLLEQAGHKVIAPDLPSHGKDKTPISKVTLQSYADCVGEILIEMIEAVILVGHSMGGIVITQAAEYVRIRSRSWSICALFCQEMAHP